MKHSAASIRAKLEHPVIDGDGHWIEPIPIFLDFLKDVARELARAGAIRQAEELAARLDDPSLCDGAQGSGAAHRRRARDGLLRHLEVCREY